MNQSWWNCSLWILGLGVSAPNLPARKQGILAPLLAIRQGSFRMLSKGIYAFPLSLKIRLTASKPSRLVRSLSLLAKGTSLPYTTLPSRKEVSALI